MCHETNKHGMRRGIAVLYFNLLSQLTLVRVLALLISLKEDTHRERKGRVPVYWEILGVRMGAAS